MLSYVPIYSFVQLNVRYIQIFSALYMEIVMQIDFIWSQYEKNTIRQCVIVTP